MKKILVFMVLMALALTAGAQNLSQQRRAQLTASSTKFTLVKIGKNKKNWYAFVKRVDVVITNNVVQRKYAKGKICKGISLIRLI